MTAKENVQKVFYEKGREIALGLQKKSSKMTGTELNAEADYIPDFTEAVKTNMLKRKIGFVCKSSAGRIVKLVQPYDSDIYPAEPEELSAQWGFVWSTNPENALPFIALSTSPYNKGDCCIDENKIWRSKIDSNVYRPTEYEQGWELA